MKRKYYTLLFLLLCSGVIYTAYGQRTFEETWIETTCEPKELASVPFYSSYLDFGDPLKYMPKGADRYRRSTLRFEAEVEMENAPKERLRGYKNSGHSDLVNPARPHTKYFYVDEDVADRMGYKLDSITIDLRSLGNTSLWKLPKVSGKKYVAIQPLLQSIQSSRTGNILGNNKQNPYKVTAHFSKKAGIPITVKQEESKGLLRLDPKPQDGKLPFGIKNLKITAESQEGWQCENVIVYTAERKQGQVFETGRMLEPAWTSPKGDVVFNLELLSPLVPNIVPEIEYIILEGVWEEKKAQQHLPQVNILPSTHSLFNLLPDPFVMTQVKEDWYTAQGDLSQEAPLGEFYLLGKGKTLQSCRVGSVPFPDKEATKENSKHLDFSSVSAEELDGLIVHIKPSKPSPIFDLTTDYDPIEPYALRFSGIEQNHPVYPTSIELCEGSTYDMKTAFDGIVIKRFIPLNRKELKTLFSDFPKEDVEGAWFRIELPEAKPDEQAFFALRVVYDNSRQKVASVVPTEGGKIILRPSRFILESTKASIITSYGFTLIAEAQPNDGYQLASITANGQDIKGKDTPQDGSYSEHRFTVLGDTEIKATFKKQTFSVSLPDATPEGTVAIKGKKASDLGAVEYGSVLEVEVLPKDGYTLATLKANDIDISKTKSFTVTEDTRIAVTFKKEEGIDTVAQDGFKIYPNPADTKVTINLGAKGTQVTEVLLYTLDSMLVDSFRVIGESVEISTSNLDSGTYLIKVGREVYRLIVRH